MQEDVIHYIWKLQKWITPALKTTTGEDIRVLQPGIHNLHSGPDFLNSQIVIGDQRWAGNVEAHLKSSDWYRHNHEKDKAYDSVILHLVWEHDVEVYGGRKTPIPTLQVSDFVSSNFITRYDALINKTNNWIPCEGQVSHVNEFDINHWLERIFVQRLENHEKAILFLLQESKGDWETVLFQKLLRGFGTNVNGEAFEQLSKKVPITLLRKVAEEKEDLEALFFGMAGLLADEKEDVYLESLKVRFSYLQHKYNLEDEQDLKVQFARLRPSNFPTIRLAQVAAIYANTTSLFSKLMAASSLNKLRGYFLTSVSDYWKNHYSFGKTSPKRSGLITASFIDILLINSIIPLRFSYAKYMGKDETELLLGWMQEIKPEQNRIVLKFKELGFPLTNALQSQSLLQLKKEYCSVPRCLHCGIGMRLIAS